MQTESIQAFVVVCDLGSFQAAANTLHLTQPAISKRIANLESRLDYQLFDRIGRQVALTEAGHAYLPHARELLAVLDDGTRALDSLGERIAGPLSLALSHHVSLHRMPDVLREFVATYPDVEPTISFMDSETACRSVVRGDSELAVITLPETSHPLLSEYRIWHDPMSVFVGQAHPLADCAPGINVVANYSAVLPPADSTTRDIIERAFEAHGLMPEPRMASQSLETLRMLAAVGLGWTVLPSAMPHSDLIELPADELDLSRELGAVVHPQRSLSNAARALLALLETARDDANT